MKEQDGNAKEKKGKVKKIILLCAIAAMVIMLLIIIIAAKLGKSVVAVTTGCILAMFLALFILIVTFSRKHRPLPAITCPRCGGTNINISMVDKGGKIKSNGKVKRKVKKIAVCQTCSSSWKV